MATQKNIIGLLYEDATNSEKRFFRAELALIEEQQGIDLFKRFQQTWQYVDQVALIPSGITTSATKHLGYDPTADSTKLSKLKMA